MNYKIEEEMIMMSLIVLSIKLHFISTVKFMDSSLFI